MLAGREWEPPTFAMPLYAFDQFEVPWVSLVFHLGEAMNLGMNLSFCARLSCFDEREHLLVLIHSSHFFNLLLRKYQPVGEAIATSDGG